MHVCVWLCWPLFRQLAEALDSLRVGETGVHELKEEFTARLSASEKKLQAVIRVCYIGVHFMNLQKWFCAGYHALKRVCSVY